MLTSTSKKKLIPGGWLKLLSIAWFPSLAFASLGLNMVGSEQRDNKSVGFFFECRSSTPTMSLMPSWLARTGWSVTTCGTGGWSGWCGLLEPKVHWAPPPAPPKKRQPKAHTLPDSWPFPFFRSSVSGGWFLANPSCLGWSYLSLVVAHGSSNPHACRMHGSWDGAWMRNRKQTPSFLSFCKD